MSAFASQLDIPAKPSLSALRQDSPCGANGRNSDFKVASFKYLYEMTLPVLGEVRRRK